jgi:hypothetical protein
LALAYYLNKFFFEGPNSQIWCFASSPWRPRIIPGDVPLHCKTGGYVSLPSPATINAGNYAAASFSSSSDRTKDAPFAGDLYNTYTLTLKRESTQIWQCD